MNKRAVAGGIIILTIMVFAIYQGTGMGRRWKALPTPSISPTKAAVSPTPDIITAMEVFENQKFGYKFMKPSGWQVTAITTDENFDDRQVFLPEGINKKGNIIEISVTVIKKPKNTQQVATDAEWNVWLERTKGATDSSGLVEKYGEKMVDGNRAVVLWQDKDLPDGYSWSIMTWIRKAGVNYYINALGAGRFMDYEARLFDYVSGTFDIK